MKFLIKPIFFVFALLFATYIVLYVEKLKPSDLKAFQGLFIKDNLILKSKNYPIKPAKGALSDEEIYYANIAWNYFVNNYNENTGLVNGKDKCPEFTFGDLTCYLMGMLSAYEIGIIGSVEVEKRINKLFGTLEKIELYENKLPNIKYHAVSLKMLDLDGKEFPEGIGWSALDLGRFFCFVNKINFHYPQYQPALRRLLKRWKMNEMIKNGFLQGMVYQSKKKKFELTQEGRLGYEEFSGKSLYRAGFDVTETINYNDFIKFIDVYGCRIGVDARETRNQNSNNYILSDPYYLDGLEYGWDLNSKELGYRVFLAQKARYVETGILTATGEDFTDDPANYIYYSIYANFNKWVCYDQKGNKRNDLRMLSTKTGFAWYVLYEDQYVDILFSGVKDLYDSKRGWYAGRYESSGKINKSISASTNGIILEALNYKKNGIIIKY
ncbi:MAG: DUF3131 domain-containing protein [Bacteroidota bacterium]|nr:DUF3131 domain-containing protein [Bacteroidota bacterium]